MDLFLIETPLQMLNALEAREHFSAEVNHLVLLLSDPFPRDVFDRLVDPSFWDSIQYLVIRNADPNLAVPLGARLRSKLLEYRRYVLQFQGRSQLNRIARASGDVRNLFLGNYLQEYMRHFAGRVPHRRLVLLDDGTDTIRINSRRRNPIPPEPTTGLLQQCKQRLHLFLHEWQTAHDEPATFFTSYDLDPREGDRVIKHAYPYHRRMLKHSCRDDSVYFLGQPLVDDGYVTAETYIMLLQAIRKYYSEPSFVYVPHKRESGPWVERLMRALGTTPRVFTLPIEYQLIRERKLPRSMGSFFCSALDNCRLIMGTELPITAFHIDRKQLLCCHDFVEDIYEYFRTQQTSHFEVISLDH